MTDYVYSFGEGNKDMKELLGGKGANLAQMTNIGLEVPPGFTVTTTACITYLEKGHLHEEVTEQIREKMSKLEDETGKKFGSVSDPLLVSVRSGAVFSMPGMMDTVLNLGLNDDTIKGLIERTNERFAYDSYRRFINMFGDVVRGIPHSEFERIMDEVKDKAGVEKDVELGAEELKELTERYKELVGDIPSDPWEQLLEAVKAVFESWNNKRAVTYRELHGLPHDMGTAVNVQAMVFGNTGEDSGSGVAFTRDPSSGENKMYGEFLMNAQGEDVVAGIRTPLQLKDLEEKLPDIYSQLQYVSNILEKEYRDMQDLEFTIEEGKLYILQTRNGKRTPNAAVKIAYDMARENLISKETALMRITGEQVEKLLHKQVDPEAEVEKIAKGLNASPGAASGTVIFDTDEAAQRGDEGEDVILVRHETTPEDIHGLAASRGVLTSRGGMTSHAAVVARGMGQPCVAGAEEISIDMKNERFTVRDIVVKKGDTITIDGTTGDVIIGDAPLIEPDFSIEFQELLRWADDIRELGVWTNADTPEDAKKAIEFGAEGIGLCRTEHMFFDPERLDAVQEMILADDDGSRDRALEKILPMQRDDFRDLFEVMDGKPIIIRLLDPPLHEFVPKDADSQKDIAEQLNVSVEKIAERVDKLQEANPMLGHRGCRLGISHPAIYRMQVKAIFEAAAEVINNDIKVDPRIMIPLVGNVKELDMIKKEIVDSVARSVASEKGVDLEFKVGTMIEIPRAAITADEIAEVAEFFSFGTNDLTQMTLGFSRDDVGTFVPNYIDKGILEHDPFHRLDQKGVGPLIEMAVVKGRAMKKDMSIGLCGEHGGEPTSVKFSYRAGLDYVSCSPFRIPIARIAAAQAKIERDRKEEQSDSTV